MEPDSMSKTVFKARVVRLLVSISKINVDSKIVYSVWGKKVNVYVGIEGWYLEWIIFWLFEAELLKSIK